MKNRKTDLVIRRFNKKDAVFCFRTRCDAFIQEFYSELTPKEVSAAVNSYMPDDYIKMSMESIFFIVEMNHVPIGFFNLKQIDRNTAEIPLIYFDLNYLGKGYGKKCIDYIEKWLSKNWKEVNTIIVDTIIPKFNSGFYRKVGFIELEFTQCEFRGINIKALRLIKKKG